MASHHSSNLPVPAHVMARAVEVFEDANAALDWLKMHNGGLQGKAPLTLVGTSEGIDAVLQTLGRIEHGLFP